MRGALDVPHVKDNTRVFLCHSYEGEIFRRLGSREETDKGLVFEEDKRAPSFEVVEQFRSGDATLDGRKSVVGRRSEQITRQVGVLVKNEDNLVRVKPAIPQTSVNSAER